MTLVFPAPSRIDANTSLRIVSTSGSLRKEDADINGLRPLTLLVCHERIHLYVRDAVASLNDRAQSDRMSFIIPMASALLKGTARNVTSLSTST